MKKLIAFLLAALLLAGMGAAASASAGEDVEPGSSQGIPVTASYKPEADPVNAYVYISWTNMSFTYHTAKKATWDPENLRYMDDGQSARWTVTDSDNTYATITLENKSEPDEQPLSAKISFSPSRESEALGNVFMRFSTDPSSLAGNYGNLSPIVLFSPGAGSSGKSTENVYTVPSTWGDPNSFGTNVPLGSITIEISKAVASDPGYPEQPEIE